MGTHPSYLYYEGFLCTLVCKDEFKDFCDKQIDDCNFDVELIRLRAVRAADDALMATVRDIEEEIARASELYRRSMRTTLLQRFRASHAIAHIGSKLRRDRSRLIVKNLPSYLTESRLREHFAAKGLVTDARVLYNDGSSRRFGFVDGADSEHSRPGTFGMIERQ
ncbi:hypothetical protein AURDEDRAFT_159859 [Auricularia subglabra TFB-10046 SS5]|nr:hypothetical protein AURDEDRAFT_159859 [Auricularia subglabra TFB-10046 SS5]